jgi:hypothetical protein
MSSNPPKAYIISRIFGNFLLSKCRDDLSFLIHYLIALAEGKSLTNYHWDSGSPWQSREWTSSLPSDAQVNITCTRYIDNGKNVNSFYSFLCIYFAHIWTT